MSARLEPIESSPVETVTADRMGAAIASGASGQIRAARRDVTVEARPQAQDERLLVQRIQAGDRHAFEQLLDSYETRVYRLALRYTGTVPDAEDVTQEIFLGIYKSMANFRGNSALGTWIYRIAMNHCLEFRRKRKLDVTPYDEELTLASHDWRENPEQSADKGELSTRVDEALRCLTPQHRDVVILHELQGLTYQEVATALNVPVGTVKSRLSNALRRLRTLLGAYIHDE